MNLKTFGTKMEGFCIGMQRVTELNYIIINLYSHSSPRCFRRKEKHCLWSFLLLFLFCLSCLFLGIRYTFFFLRLSNTKAPLIKTIIVKVVLMLMFLANVIKFLYNFVHTFVTDFLKK